MLKQTIQWVSSDFFINIALFAAIPMNPSRLEQPEQFFLSTQIRTNIQNILLKCPPYVLHVHYIYQYPGFHLLVMKRVFLEIIIPIWRSTAFFFFELMKARLHVRVSYPCRHFITPPLVTQSVLYFTKKRSLVK